MCSERTADSYITHQQTSASQFRLQQRALQAQQQCTLNSTGALLCRCTFTVPSPRAPAGRRMRTQPHVDSTHARTGRALQTRMHAHTSQSYTDFARRACVSTSPEPSGRPGCYAVRTLISRVRTRSFRPSRPPWPGHNWRVKESPLLTCYIYRGFIYGCTAALEPRTCRPWAFMAHGRPCTLAHPRDCTASQHMCTRPHDQSLSNARPRVHTRATAI